jgi:hypothetical protein
MLTSRMHHSTQQSGALQCLAGHHNHTLPVPAPDQEHLLSTCPAPPALNLPGTCPAPSSRHCKAPHPLSSSTAHHAAQPILPWRMAAAGHLTPRQPACSHSHSPGHGSCAHRQHTAGHTHVTPASTSGSHALNGAPAPALPPPQSHQLLPVLLTQLRPAARCKAQVQLTQASAGSNVLQKAT